MKVSLVVITALVAGSHGELIRGEYMVSLNKKDVRIERKRKRAMCIEKACRSFESPVRMFAGVNKENTHARMHNLPLLHIHAS